SENNDAVVATIELTEDEPVGTEIEVALSSQSEDNSAIAAAIESVKERLVGAEIEVALPKQSEDNHVAESVTPKPLIGKYKGESFEYFLGKGFVTTEAGQVLYQKELQGKTDITQVSDNEFVFTSSASGVITAVTGQPVKY